MRDEEFMQRTMRQLDEYERRREAPPPPSRLRLWWDGRGLHHRASLIVGAVIVVISIWPLADVVVQVPWENRHHIYAPAFHWFWRFAVTGIGLGGVFVIMGLLPSKSKADCAD
jgi:hypothetical protein